MAIHELTHGDLIRVKTVTLASQNIRERDNLQRVLRVHIDAIGRTRLSLQRKRTLLNLCPIDSCDCVWNLQTH